MNELKKKWFVWIRTGNLLHSMPTLYHLSYFRSYELPFLARLRFRAEELLLYPWRQRLRPHAKC